MDQFAENAILIPLAFIRFFVIMRGINKREIPGKDGPA